MYRDTKQNLKLTLVVCATFIVYTSSLTLTRAWHKLLDSFLNNFEVLPYIYLLDSFLNNYIRSSRYTPVLERFNLNYMYRNFHFIVRFEADGVALSFVFGLLLFYVKVRCYVEVFNTLKSCTDIRNKTWNSRWLSATFIMYTSSLP